MANICEADEQAMVGQSMSLWWFLHTESWELHKFMFSNVSLFTVHCAANANTLMLKNLYWKEEKANNSSSSASAILEWKRLSPLDSSGPYGQYQLIC